MSSDQTALHDTPTAKTHARRQQSSARKQYPFQHLPTLVSHPSLLQKQTRKPSHRDPRSRVAYSSHPTSPTCEVVRNTTGARARLRAGSGHWTLQPLLCPDAALQLVTLTPDPGPTTTTSGSGDCRREQPQSRGTTGMIIVARVLRKFL